MPQRSNFFQDVVALVHKHLAPDAVIEESAMLPHRITGDDREVDVLLRGSVAGHPVVIGVEATASGRKASVQWVEQQLGKHEQLDTDKVVLVSDAGFYKNARKLATAKGAIVVAPEDLAGGDPTFEIVNNLSTLWAKVYSLGPNRVTLTIDNPILGAVVEMDSPPRNLDICKADGEVLCPLETLVEILLNTHAAEQVRSDTMRDVAESTDGTFTLTMDPVIVNINDVPAKIYARWLSGDGSSSLHEITVITVAGDRRISVQRMDLTHKRFGDAIAAYSEMDADGKQALFVATAANGEERVTVRVRDSPNGPVRDQVLIPFARGGTLT